MSNDRTNNILTNIRDLTRLLICGNRQGLKTSEQRSRLIKQMSQTDKRRNTSIKKNTIQSYDVTLK